MTRAKMLNRLQYSENKIIASAAQRIVEGYESIDEAKKHNYGHFMSAVLDGDHQEALCYADDENRRCIAEEYDIEEEQYSTKV